MAPSKRVNKGAKEEAALVLETDDASILEDNKTSLVDTKPKRSSQRVANFAKAAKEVDSLVTGNAEIVLETPVKGNKRGAKGSGSGRVAKIPKEVERILLPEDLTNNEKDLLWLWAYYKTSSDVSPSHTAIAKCLGITVSVSKHRFHHAKLSIEDIQKRAEKIAPRFKEDEDEINSLQGENGSQGDTDKNSPSMDDEACVEESIVKIES